MSTEQNKPSKQQNKITVSIHKSTRAKLNLEFIRVLNSTGEQLSIADLIERVIAEVEAYREQVQEKIEIELEK